MASIDESVLVFPRRILEELGVFQGLNFDYRRYIDAILSPRVAMFVSRARAEVDESTKQIIPYVIVAHGDRVLFYVRGKESGESRLIDKASFGFGGHIRQEDDSLFHNVKSLMHEIYSAALEREVAEELKFTTPYEQRIVAVLNDDSDSVGRVHFGIVHLCRVSSPDVSKRERLITRLSFLDKTELRSQPVQLETWSNICLERLDDILGAWR